MTPAELGNNEPAARRADLGYQASLAAQAEDDAIDIEVGYATALRMAA